MKKVFCKRGVLNIILLITATSFLKLANGQNVDGDYKAVANGSWSILTNWQRYNGATSTWNTPTPEQGYPGEKSQAGNVFIQSGNNLNIQASPSFPITSLTVGPGSNPKLSFEAVSDVTLIVKNNVSVIDGTIDVTNVKGINNHTLRIGGDLIINGSAGFKMISADDINDNCTVIFDGLGSQSVGGGAGKINFYNLILQNPNAPVYANTNIGIGQSLNVESNAIFMPCEGCIVGEALIYNNSYYGTLNGSGTVRVTRKLNNRHFSSQYALTLNIPNLTVDYAGNGAQTVEYIAGKPYKNVILSEAGTRSFDPSVTINGSLSLEGTAITAGSAPIYGPSASLRYKGTANQTTGIEFLSTWTSAGGVIIDNEKGVTLNQSKTIKSSLILRQGHFIIPVNKTLTIDNNAMPISNAGNEFNNDKHIVTEVDPLTKSFGVLKVNNISTNGFTFPVGDGLSYLPATVVPTENNNIEVNVFTGFTADGKPGNPLPANQRTNVLNSIWNVRGSVNIPTTVTLGWPIEHVAELEGSGFKFALEENIGIANFNGNEWDAAEGISDLNRYTAKRSISTFSSTFSPLTVSLMNYDVLPVHFSSVKASQRPSGVEISFTNLTESDVAYYEIERSVGEQPFCPIKKMTPTKNNYGSASYQCLDASSFEGRISYRIKAVETTGKVIYSKVVFIIKDICNSDMIVFTQSGQVMLQIGNLPAGHYHFYILTTLGQVVSVEDINHRGGAFSQSIPLHNPKPGVYIISVKGPVQMQKKFIVP